MKIHQVMNCITIAIIVATIAAFANLVGKEKLLAAISSFL